MLSKLSLRVFKVLQLEFLLVISLKTFNLLPNVFEKFTTEESLECVESVPQERQELQLWFPILTRFMSGLSMNVFPSKNTQFEPKLLGRLFPQMLSLRW